MTTDISLGKEDASAIFGHNFVRTRYEDIPAEAVDAVKKSVLDTLGVCLAASSLAAGGRELLELAGEGSGQGESTLLVSGRRAPAWMAAFANGGLSHGLDFDDVHYEGPTHPSGAVVPAAFAVAERVAPTTGKDFITAVALGHDMVMRMTSSMLGEVDLLGNWLSFSIFGVFAAAATSARLLRLDQNRTHMAISIALAYAAGAGEIRRGNLRGLYNSWAAMGGVLSALMAGKGITGSPTPLEGEHGFFNAYFQRKYDRAVLLGDLGKKFHGTSFGYKPWPSCASTHPGIDATLQLVREHHLRPEDIAQIKVLTGPHARVNCEPVEYMRRPTAIMDAKFSIPFTVALAVVKKRVTLGDFTPEAIRDPAVLEMAQRVTPVLDPAHGAEHGLDPAIVEIKTKTGKEYTRRVDVVYGHPRNPMTMEAIISKFKDCAAYAARPLSAGKLEKVVSLVLKLEDADDVSGIMRLLG